MTEKAGRNLVSPKDLTRRRPGLNTMLHDIDGCGTDAKKRLKPENKIATVMSLKHTRRRFTPLVSIASAAYSLYQLDVEYVVQ